MPQYNFFVSGWDTLLESQSLALPDLKEARRAASSMAGDWLKNPPLQFWDENEIRCDVEDAEGIKLFSILTCSVEGALRSLPQSRPHSGPSL